MGGSSEHAGARADRVSMGEREQIGRANQGSVQARASVCGKLPFALVSGLLCGWDGRGCRATIPGDQKKHIFQVFLLRD